jgi:hypothetical protein
MEQRLDRDAFRALFRGSAGSLAFHLELKEAYGVAEEDEPYRRFLAGELDDYAWRDGYFKLIRDVTSRGVKVRRVRLVSEPLNDYARFLLYITPGNIAAGEDVRYLPRARAGDVSFPAEDCWLFDRATLVLLRYLPDGRSDGFWTDDDAALTARYRTACDQAWARAVPYPHYVGTAQRP